MEKRKDIAGKIPELWDIVVYNPPGYKGIKMAYVTGFAKSGLPKTVEVSDLNLRKGDTLEEKHVRWMESYSGTEGYTPKTGFAIISRHE